MEEPMRPLARLIVVGVSALALAACATTNVRSFVVRGIDVGQYRTYSWGPAGEHATGDPRLDNNQFFQERIQAAVERHLNARGFEKTAAEASDLFIRYHASVEQLVNPNGLDRPYASCDGCEPYVYDAGTIVIDLVDARTHRLVWRGWAEGGIDGVVDDQTWMEKRVDDTVARIMERLPRGMGRVS
jgi:hypothetical protein